MPLLFGACSPGKGDTTSVSSLAAIEIVPHPPRRVAAAKHAMNRIMVSSVRCGRSATLRLFDFKFEAVYDA